MSMSILLRLLVVRGLPFMVALLTMGTSALCAAAVSAQTEKQQTRKEKVTSTASVYVPPEYDRKEFQYFTDHADNGDPALSRAELTPLLLAPKFDVQLMVGDGVNIPRLKQRLSEKYGAKITDALSPYGVLARFFVEVPSDTTQDQLVRTLNELSAESGGILDVVPVFYVDHREAIVSGIVTKFAAPFSRRQFAQMLENYGGFQGLNLSEGPNGLTWTIVPAMRRFALEPPRDLRGMKRKGKFDAHLLLLANLLETQKLLKGVVVVSARPEWTFLEGPIAGKLSVEWPADTVGGVRLLRLEVSVSDSAHVRFDPKKVPPLGSSGFELHVGSLSDTVLPGWSKFAEGGKISEKKEWTIASPKQIVRGGRVFTVHTFTRQFYVFQPEPSLSLTGVEIPYEYREQRRDPWRPMSVNANSLTLNVLPHRQKDEPIAMPTPPVYPFALAVQAFLAPSEFARGENQHWFSAWVERAKGWGISVSTVGMFSLALLLFATILLLLSMLLWVGYVCSVNACAPQAIPFLSLEEFTESLRKLSRKEDSVQALREEMIGCRNLIETLLVAKIPGLALGQVTIPVMKELIGKFDRDQGFTNVLTQSVDLLLLTNLIDAPKEAFPPEVIAGDLELLRAELPAFYAALALLPPRMKP